MIRNGVCLDEDELKILLGVTWKQKLKDTRREMERKEYLLNTLKQGDIIYHNVDEVIVLGINYMEGIIIGKMQKKYGDKSIKHVELNPISIRTKKEHFFNRNIYEFDKTPIIRVKDEDVKNTIEFLESIYGEISVNQFHNKTRIMWYIALESNQLSRDDIKRINLWLGKTIEEIKVIKLTKLNGKDNLLQHIIFNYEKSKI